VVLLVHRWIGGRGKLQYFMISGTRDLLRYLSLRG